MMKNVMIMKQNTNNSILWDYYLWDSAYIVSISSNFIYSWVYRDISIKDVYVDTDYIYILSWNIIHKCNKLTLETISTSWTISWANWFLWKSNDYIYLNVNHSISTSNSRITKISKNDLSIIWTSTQAVYEDFNATIEYWWYIYAWWHSVWWSQVCWIEEYNSNMSWNIRYINNYRNSLNKWSFYYNWFIYEISKPSFNSNIVINKRNILDMSISNSVWLDNWSNWMEQQMYLFWNKIYQVWYWWYIHVYDLDLNLQQSIYTSMNITSSVITWNNLVIKWLWITNVYNLDTLSLIGSYTLSSDSLNIARIYN